MIIIGYLILAVIVMGFSIQLSNYVDIIDKRTSISGAFIGGVILAAITSLPELFTSISATALLGQPELVIGNILGSDIFNTGKRLYLIDKRTFTILHCLGNIRYNNLVFLIS